jgi:predicted nuclease with TOPRIM domain
MTNKKFKVIADLQGGTFGMDREYTLKEWKQQALDWADSEASGELYKDINKTPLKNIIDTISEIWQLEFKEIKVQEPLKLTIAEREERIKKLKVISACYTEAINRLKQINNELNKLINY